MWQMTLTGSMLRLFSSALVLNGCLQVHGIRIPLERREVSIDDRSSLRARTTLNGTTPLTNTDNFIYTGVVEVGGTSYNLQIDTGSADLWVSGTVPASSSDVGTAVTIHYGLGQAAGNVHTGTASFSGYNVASQAFLYVNDASSIPFPSGVFGIAGIGPSQGSQIQDALGLPKGATFLDQIFNLNGSSSNFVTFLMSRLNDTGAPSAAQTSELTIEEVLPAYSTITSQPKLPVTIVQHPTADVQHFSADLASINGPDGKKISFSSQSLGAPSGQSITVLDSGTSLAYVIRAVSDAIYGRVQRAEYNTDQEMWMVPCDQELNVTLIFGGVSYPIHPLDTVIQQSGLNFADGSVACGGAIAPNTSPSAEFDHLMGDTIMRNMYTLMNYGDFIGGTSSKAAPFMQLLPLTDASKAHQDFVNARLGGVDTTGNSSYTLLSKGQTSPATAAEKTQQTLGFFQTHKTLAIIIGIAILCLLFALFTCLCCCCFRRRGGSRNKQTPNYRNPQGAPPVFQPWAGAYRGLADPRSAPAEGGAVPLEDMEHGSQNSRLSNPFRDSYGGHSRGPSGASYRDPFADSNGPHPNGPPPHYQ